MTILVIGDMDRVLDLTPTNGGRRMEQVHSGQGAFSLIWRDSDAYTEKIVVLKARSLGES